MRKFHVRIIAKFFQPSSYKNTENTLKTESARDKLRAERIQALLSPKNETKYRE